ncbi:MAG: RNA polymerase sigma-70 factor [Chitinophagaceae bacterium]|nr:RNA polymerase sigma-70 factor [Chitinophagaceae bacterium]
MEKRELIAELQRQIALCDDMAAYRKLYDSLHRELFLFSYSIIKSREVAEEIVSDVFIKLWRIRNELPAIENLTVFMYTIARNLSINHITRNYKYPKVSLDTIEVENIATFDNGEELFISAELSRRVGLAIQGLPSQCKLVFQLAREHGLKYREVAAILNISELTVRNQLVIAAKKIAAAAQLDVPTVRTRQKSM